MYLYTALMNTKNKTAFLTGKQRDKIEYQNNKNMMYIVATRFTEGSSRSSSYNTWAASMRRLV